MWTSSCIIQYLQMWHFSSLSHFKVSFNRFNGALTFFYFISVWSSKIIQFSSQEMIENKFLWYVLKQIDWKRYPTTRLGKLMRANTLAKVTLNQYQSCCWNVLQRLLLMIPPLSLPGSISRSLSSVMNLYQATPQSTSLTGTIYDIDFAGLDI